MIRKMQQATGTEQSFFALKLPNDSPDIAYIWAPEVQAFPKYRSVPGDRGPRFELTPDVIREPHRWSAIAWFTAEGLQQFLAWPEFLALDETYKALLLVLPARSAVPPGHSTRSPEFEANRTYTGFRALLAEAASENIIR